MATTTLYSLAESIDYDSSLIHNDRGNGCGGPGYEDPTDVMVEIETRDREDSVLERVTEQEDPDAWRLSRDAFSVLGLDATTVRSVYLGKRESGDNGYQIIYAI